MVLPIIQQDPGTTVMTQLQGLSSARTQEMATKASIPGIKAKSRIMETQADEFQGETATTSRQRELEKLIQENDEFLSNINKKKRKMQAEQIAEQSQFAADVYSHLNRDKKYSRTSAEALGAKDKEALMNFNILTTTKEKGDIYDSTILMEDMDPVEYETAAARFNAQYGELGVTLSGNKEEDKERLTTLRKYALADVSHQQKLREAAAAKQYKATERDKKLAFYTNLLNDSVLATKLVDGFVDIEPNKADGTLRITDKVSGEVKVIPLGATSIGSGEIFPKQDFQQKPDDEVTTSEYGDIMGTVEGTGAWDWVMAGTGVQSSLKLAGNFAASFWSDKAPFAKEERARALLKALPRDIARARALNKRYPTTEITSILKDLAVNPSAFAQPAILRERLAAVQDMIFRKMVEEERIVGDPSTPEKLRTEIKAGIKDASNIIRRLQVPKYQMALSFPQNELYTLSKEDFMKMSGVELVTFGKEGGKIPKEYEAEIKPKIIKYLREGASK